MAETLYDQDFYAWTKDQAAKLRRLAVARVNLPEAVDLDIVAEEIEDLGKRDLRALVSEIAGILEHLLKLEHSPAAAPRAGWRRSVRDHRFEAAQILRHSPGLRQYLDAELGHAYRKARADAADGLGEDGIAASALPETCPYSWEQILNADEASGPNAP